MHLSFLGFSQSTFKRNVGKNCLDRLLLQKCKQKSMDISSVNFSHNKIKQIAFSDVLFFPLTRTYILRAMLAMFKLTPAVCVWRCVVQLHSRCESNLTLSDSAVQFI